MLALFAVGLPLDVILATRLGSSSVILGVPLGAAGAWQVIRTGRVRKMAPALLVLAAFAAWSAVTLAWARDHRAVVVRVTTVAQLLAFVWLSWQLIRSAREIRATLMGYLLGCVIAVIDAWRGFQSGREMLAYNRYAAEAFDPNDMAVTLALGIPMAAYLAVSAGRPAALVAPLYVPLALVGIALSGSRGGALAAGAGVAAALVCVARRGKVMLVWAIVLLAAGAAVVGVGVPDDSWARVYTIRQQVATGSVGDRAPIWAAGVGVLAEHPIAGIGTGGFSHAVAPVLGVGNVAHNTPLSIAVETGAVGLVLFLAVLGAIVVAVRRCDRDERVFAFGLLFTWLVGTASLTWEMHKATWLVLLIGAALGALRPPVSSRA